MRTGLVFLDTNILIYAADDRFPDKQEIAARLVLDPSTPTFVSPQVIAEMLRVMVGKFEIPAFNALRLIEPWQHRCVVAVDFQFVREASLISALHSVSIFDAQIVLAAVRSNCKVIYSEDMQDGFKYQGVEIVNPFKGL